MQPHPLIQLCACGVHMHDTMAQPHALGPGNGIAVMTQVGAAMASVHVHMRRLSPPGCTGSIAA
jgi:hypothetical protein